jgi:hypothetical protein
MEEHNFDFHSRFFSNFSFNRVRAARTWAPAATNYDVYASRREILESPNPKCNGAGSSRPSTLRIMDTPRPGKWIQSFRDRYLNATAVHRHCNPNGIMRPHLKVFFYTFRLFEFFVHLSIFRLAGGFRLQSSRRFLTPGAYPVLIDVLDLLISRKNRRCYTWSKMSLCKNWISSPTSVFPTQRRICLNVWFQAL